MHNATFALRQSGWLVLFLGIFLATSCVPRAISGSASRPINLDDVGEVVVPSSGEWFVSDSFPAFFLSIRVGDVPNRAYDSRSGQTFGRSVLSDVRLTDKRLPEGWDVTLISAQGRQIIVENDKTGDRERTVSWFETVELTFKISIPESANQGVYEIGGEIITDEGVTRSYDFVVIVEEPVDL